LLGVSASETYIIEWAGTYEEGQQALLRPEHTVFLIDQRLDGGRGAQLVHEARRRGSRAPMLLLTASDEAAAAQKPLGGATGYLVTHELTPELLEGAIRFALAQCRTPEAGTQGEGSLQPGLVTICMYCRYNLDGDLRPNPDHRAAEPARCRVSHGICRCCWDTVVKAQLEQLGVNCPPEFGVG
jgi:DNA-binding response OmpR family regulator